VIVTATVSETIQLVRNQSSKGIGIGFVPTMGALHDGHISLINKAKADNDFVVCSIFVNPAQFNNKNDLLNYPRSIGADREMLSKAGCDLVFIPTESEIYPTASDFEADFGNLETVMEGKFRPGHFKGVAKVVARLFEIILPDKAYFGEKDFQQLTVIRELIRKMELKIEIIGCPTLREADGLAMSSRNIHLTAEERNAAPVIFEVLTSARNLILKHGIDQAHRMLIGQVENFKGFKVQYLEFVDASTLLPIQKLDLVKEQRTCIAVLTSKTRLIDNMVL